MALNKLLSQSTSVAVHLMRSGCFVQGRPELYATPLPGCIALTQESGEFQCLKLLSLSIN